MHILYDWICASYLLYPQAFIPCCLNVLWIIFELRCRLGRTSEFLIYGQGQQRNAIIEAIRLLEIGKSENKDGALLIGELSNSLNNPKQFKDKAKKWQKFVAQVLGLFKELVILNPLLKYFCKSYINLSQFWCKFIITLIVYIKNQIVCLQRSPVFIRSI